MATLHPFRTLEDRDEDELQTALRRHAAELAEHEPGARAGGAEELHKQRVATRRLRSLLRSARPALADPAGAEWLRQELRWFGGLLGEVRDRDVLIAYLLDELQSIEEAAAFGGVLELLDNEREAARGELMDALDSDRYRELLRRLEDPPALREAGLFEDAAANEYGRLRRSAERLDADPPADDLHRVRIKVKRARYAAEAIDADARFVARAKDVQDVLGEHQDATVAEARIRELVGLLRGTGRTALCAGRLIERQRGRRAAAQAAWPKAWKRLRRAGDRAWR